MANTALPFDPAHATEVFSLHYDGQVPPCITATQPAFLGTAAAQVGYKIYVVVNADGVHYVGCTRTSMGARLRLGIQRFRHPSGAYRGYQWLKLPALRLFVFPLPSMLLALADASNTKLSVLAERIEAELVYAVRTHTGQWPLHQTEIHFHNLSTTPTLANLTTKIAQLMYNRLEQQIIPTTPHGYPHQYTNPGL